MEAIRKQASKLREQVAKQQQAVLKQFSGRFGHDSALHDEAELKCLQNLLVLYSSTKAAKHLQRDIARGVEALISVSYKQIEILRKLAQDCCKYGDEYHQASGYALARACSDFGNSHNLMESERENLLGVLGEQVYEPLRAMVMGAPLEDARHLTYRYKKISQDVEGQTAEVLKRQLRSKEVASSAESAAKLRNAEMKLSELRRALSALGREATDAMQSVEAQQQEVTFQRLLAMVDAERLFHQKAAVVLDKLYNEMVQLKHQDGSSSKFSSPTKQHSSSAKIDATAPNENTDVCNDQSSSSFADAENGADNIKPHHSPKSPENKTYENLNDKVDFPREISANGQSDTNFVAETDGELSISVGDYIVVRQVAQSGWSEGECKGKAGWFPSAYVEKREKAPASKVIALLSC
ncbi:SH3 domain-containing protein 2-like isoform X2 [Phalaenopsis equestris]|uniref:SH3 domain-containing protein 2-like isoform X2 n=1 Tax=Phalaenopsis equestris TaxID=78828 RepID=UPI0009E23B8C|nr:SH3 domain-containing protein 2-like isoform X2 [Phalaenopsis equestris]